MAAERVFEMFNFCHKLLQLVIQEEFYQALSTTLPALQDATSDKTHPVITTIFTWIYWPASFSVKKGKKYVLRGGKLVMLHCSVSVCSFIPGQHECMLIKLT